MTPLSCANCCHNPLQTGTVGYPVGHCTRFKLTLLAPSHTTCGNLQRKDLQRERAEMERVEHARTFSTSFVSDLTTAKRSALVAHGTHPIESTDVVLREIHAYGMVSKIASLAALRAMSGVRAELALTSLGRSYFANCMRRDGRWTSGIHLAWWMLGRLADAPRVELQDLREESTLPLEQRVEMANWYVVTARLLLLLDVANASRNQAGANGMPQLSKSIIETFVSVPAGNGTRLIRHLTHRRKKFAAALPEKHYSAIATELHRERGATADD